MAGRKKRAKKDGPGRLAQIRSAYTMTRKGDPRIGWILLGILLAFLIVFTVIGLLLKTPVLWGIFGLTAGVLAVTVVFGRRAETSAYKQVEGQPGAALSALSTLRKGFTVTKDPIAFNRNQDLVLRVVGKCGVVLVGEGAPSRVQQMLVAEKRRYQRVLGDIPVHDLQAGNAEGQIPLRKLTGTIMKLPRTLNGPQMTELEHRLKALAVTQSPLPIPKGPLPKGIKMPKTKAQG
jgi:hypothetical protein